MKGLRERKKQERRQRIFSSAVELFNSKGFSNTSMQDLADKSDLAVGTLYNYFNSKNDLLLEIIQDEMEDSLQDSIQSLSNLDFQKKGIEEILKEVAVNIISIPLIFNKETLQEIFIAILHSKQDTEKGIMLDLELLDVIADLLDQMKKEKLVSQRFNSESISQAFYSLIITQMMFYLYNLNMSAEELISNTKLSIEMIYYGIIKQNKGD